MLKVDNLYAYYGRVAAVRGVSLEIKEGELVTLVGANGAGKSTLLMAISGIVRPVTGTIEFSGREIGRLQPHVIARLGFIQVPQGRLLFPALTVLDNLVLGASGSSNADPKMVQQRLHEVFGLFEVLGRRQEQKAGTLSGGEQQMLAIGRALMASPKLLALDEPTFGLAPIMVERLREVISQLHERGVTILLVEQNVHLALDLADRAYVLQNGGIVAEGKASEIARSKALEIAFLGRQAHE